MQSAFSSKNFEPLFAKNLLEVVLQELESLNNQFKTKQSMIKYVLFPLESQV